MRLRKFFHNIFERLQDTIIIGESDYEIQFQFLVDLIDTESHFSALTFKYN